MEPRIRALGLGQAGHTFRSAYGRIPEVDQQGRKHPHQRQNKSGLKPCGGERRPDVILDLVQNIGDVSQELVDATDLGSFGGLASQQGSKHHHDQYDGMAIFSGAIVLSPVSVHADTCNPVKLQRTWVMTTEFSSVLPCG